MGGKSSKKKAVPEDLPVKSPFDNLVDGAVVFLTSKASSKLLRFHEDKVDALGEEGENSKFTVHKKDSESGHVVTLQNDEKYLKISEEGVVAVDDESEVKVVDAEGGCVAFESSGHYLSVQEDGSVQSASELGPSAHFTPYSAVKQEEAAAAEPTTDEPAESEEKTEAKKEEKTEDESEAPVENKEDQPEDT